MAYNKNLYSSNVSALDAGIIYDQNQQLMQDEINAGIKDGDIIVGQADNLASDQNQFSTGEFIERTTGGDASLSDGDGDLILIRGSKLHEGYYAQSVDMELTRASGSEINATIDNDTFLSQMVSDSGTFTTVYNGSSWSYNPGTYGITVTGTPLENDTITVIYQKEIRGTITMSNPQTFVSTGWNLYNHDLGYARVLKYHETYGFGISGTYTALQFSSTISGTKTSVTVTDGKFNITEDGYIWVTGGNDTDTAIWMTWSDWQSEPNGGTWEAYTEDSVDFSSVMTSYFPYGLMAVEGYRDEIDFSLKKATVNVGRLVYNSTNLELARSYRTAVDYDEDYIYYGLPEPEVNEISIANDYMAYDHGIEYFTDTEVEVYTQTLYGVNLKNKLERDVLTLSQQTLTENQKTQVQKNIGINDKIDGIVNPNLLDNWYFVGGGSQLGDGIFPINSRGQTSYSGLRYTIDRWSINKTVGSVSLNSGYLQIDFAANNQYTNFEISISESVTKHISGKQVTLSVLFNNTTTENLVLGCLATGGYTQGSVPSTSNLLCTITKSMPSGISGSTRFFIQNLSTNAVTAKVIAAKLELGSTQTLAHQENGVWVLNEIPNYEEQLLRCKTSTADSTDYYANQDVMTNYMVTNPNLLDNWYFDGGGSHLGDGIFPINSRGNTTYTGSTYTIDRWRTWDGGSTLTVNNGYITFSTGSNGDGLFQYMSNIWQFQNKTLTVSALIDGKIYSGTGKTTSTGWISRNIDNDGSYVAFVLTSSEANFRIYLASNKSVNIRAVKLELGTMQTLGYEEPDTVGVLNELPNFEEQLLRCETSAYRVVNKNLLDNWYFVGGGSQLGDGIFPINQRGQTSYSGNTRVIDRFQGEAGSSVTVNSSYVSFSGNVIQFISLSKLKDLTGKTITISALQYYNGQTYLKSKSGIVNAYTTDTDIQVGFEGSGSIAFRMFSNASSWQGCRINGPVNLIAVKLELGSTQTLAHQENGTWVLNEIPDYSEQLYRCCASTVDHNDTCANNPYFVPSVEAISLDSSLVSSSIVSIVRYGKLRILNLAADMKNAGSWQTVYTLDSKDRPKEQLTSIAGGYGKQVSEAYVQTDGKIKINAIEAGWLKSTAVWMTN